ncbi:MAG: TetR family transcriptional regulator [Solobacterium sp.]|nr:TetR family transcriptional regulator [Solobacterium sp.]
MKYEFSENMPRSRRRTLNTFAGALQSLLLQKSFDDITVRDICELSLLPKSTFYNYFDDKYDLLNFLFYYSRQAITGAYGDWDMYSLNKAAAVVSAILVDHRDELRRILELNPDGSTFQWVLLQFAIRAFDRIRIKFKTDSEDDFPPELQAKINAYKLLAVMEWIIRRTDIDLAETLRLLGQILSTENEPQDI